MFVFPLKKGYLPACCQGLCKTGCYDDAHCSDNLRWEKLRDLIVLQADRNKCLKGLSLDADTAVCSLLSVTGTTFCQATGCI